MRRPQNKIATSLRDRSADWSRNDVALLFRFLLYLLFYKYLKMDRGVSASSAAEGFSINGTGLKEVLAELFQNLLHGNLSFSLSFWRVFHWDLFRQLLLACQPTLQEGCSCDR